MGRVFLILLLPVVLVFASRLIDIERDHDPHIDEGLVGIIHVGGALDFTSGEKYLL